MNGLEEKMALITGANVGIGNEVARQLALSGQYRKIILACRNVEKAETAKRALEESTGKSIFQVLQLDLTKLDSVRTAIATLSEPIHDLVMNAGGAGGKTPFALTDDGVTAIFASNVLGHVALLEGLIKANKLKRAAVFSGSEAARGVPKLGMKRPALVTSSADEFASLCDGTYFNHRKADSTLAYGQVKYVGAMWMAALARRTPYLKLITMSPGNTRGTEVSRDFALPMRLLLTTVLMPLVLPRLGLVHNVSDGAKRLVNALSDNALRSGVFYASEANTLTGPIVDQSGIFRDLSNQAYQDNAYEAVHRFLELSRPRTSLQNEA
jgi:NAD(P)-dependent dehydrogenase (short-subunit alcohol dehydrogenase family)